MKEKELLRLTEMKKIEEEFYEKKNRTNWRN